jgi:Ring finger domain
LTVIIILDARHDDADEAGKPLYTSFQNCAGSGRRKYRRRPKRRQPLADASVALLFVGVACSRRDKSQTKFSPVAHAHAQRQLARRSRAFMQGPGRPGRDPRSGRMGARSTGANNMLATAAVAAVAGLAGMAAADHARAQAEGRESAVQSMFRWFTEDLLGVEAGGQRAGGAGPSRQRGAGGLSRAEIAALPTRTYRQVDVERAERLEREAQAEGGGCTGEVREKQMCAICQDVFVPEDRLLRLLCLHEYHFDCISSFLSTSSQPVCPCCRHPVVIS